MEIQQQLYQEKGGYIRGDEQDKDSRDGGSGGTGRVIA